MFCVLVCTRNFLPPLSPRGLVIFSKSAEGVGFWHFNFKEEGLSQEGWVFFLRVVGIFHQFFLSRKLNLPYLVGVTSELGLSYAFVSNLASIRELLLLLIYYVFDVVTEAISNTKKKFFRWAAGGKEMAIRNVSIEQGGLKLEEGFKKIINYGRCCHNMGNPSEGVFRVGLEIPKTLWFLSLWEFNLGNNFIVICFSNIYGKQ